jgi:hypothetical protein
MTAIQRNGRPCFNWLYLVLILACAALSDPELTLQPRMTLAKADAQTIELVFARKGNDINPAKEKHMHAVRIAFTDNDHILQKWTMFEKGKDTGGVTLKLTRVK